LDRFYFFTWHPSDLLAFRIALNVLGCQVEIPRPGQQSSGLNWAYLYRSRPSSAVRVTEPLPELLRGLAYLRRRYD
jgi:hypothetical protein